jgi:hypothetical protein
MTAALHEVLGREPFFRQRIAYALNPGAEIGHLGATSFSNPNQGRRGPKTQKGKGLINPTESTRKEEFPF